MSTYKSKLFKRNNAGKRSALMAQPFPFPGPSRRNVNVKESKYIQNNQQQQLCHTDGVISHLDVIDQGVDQDERLGQKFQVTECHIQGSITINAATTQLEQAGYTLVWDTQPNRALPSTFGTVLNGTPSQYAFPNPDRQDRFIYLAKREFTLTKADATNSAGYNDSSIVKINAKHIFKRKLVACCSTNQTSGVIANRPTGALLLLTTGISAVANASTMDFSYRVYFHDV